MWTLGQIVDRSVSDGIDEPDAIQIADQRHKELVRRSGWRRATVNLGATDGSTATFALPAEVSRVLFVRVELADGSIVRYPDRIGEDDYWAIRAGDIDTGKHVFTTDEDADAGVELALYPTPEAGTLFAKCETYPATLVNRTDELEIPDDFAEALLDGIKAVVFKELDEDVGSAAALEQNFENAVVKLAGMVKARGVGDGPIAIPMRGVNW